MASFAFSQDQRDGWRARIGAALVAAGTNVRKQVTLSLVDLAPDADWDDTEEAPEEGDDTGYDYIDDFEEPESDDVVFDDESEIFSPDDWWTEVQQTAGPVLDKVAKEAAKAFVAGTGLTVDATTRDAAAVAASAGVAATLASRGDVIQSRLSALLDRGEGADATDLADALGVVDGDLSGPMSDALMESIADGVTTGIVEGSAMAVADAAKATGQKQWNCAFVNSRESHMEADGQTVAIEEPFTVGDSEGFFPGDPDLPVEEVANCRCWLTFDVDSAAAEDLLTEAEAESEAEMAVASLTLAVSPPTLCVDIEEGPVDPSVERGPVTLRTMRRHPGEWITRSTSAYQNSGVVVTVEPTGIQKAALAVPGGETPADLHVTVLYLAVDPTDTDARTAISAVLATAAATTGPIDGEVSGLGWFDDPAAMTLALIDAPGLANLRAALHQALADAGYPADDTHDFEPHITLAFSQVDATDKVHQPLSFSELRLRWANDTLVYDLLGVDQPPSPAPEPAPEAPPPPAPADNQTQEAPAVAPPAPTAATNVTAEEFVDTMPADPTGMAPTDMPDMPDGEDTPSEDETDVSDLNTDGILDEVAQRIVDRAATDTGVTPADTEPADTEEDLEEMLALLLDELEEELTGGEDSTDQDTPPAPADTPDMPTDMPPPAPTASPMMSTRHRLALALRRRQTLAAAPPDGDQIAAAPELPADPAVYDAEGILTLEDTLSGDGRMIAAGSLTWRDLPLPLMLQTVNNQGHLGSEFCGWIHEIERVGTSIIGRMNFCGEAGDRAREILADPKGAGRFGVSADVDSVQSVFTDPDGEELDGDQIAESFFGEPLDMIEVLVSGRLMGATLCPFPAFMEAQVYLLDRLDERETALVAAAHNTDSVSGGVWRSTIPAAFSIDGALTTKALVASAGVSDHPAPPADLFGLKPMTDPVPFHVGSPLADGTVPCYGLVAEWGTCHIGDSSKCIPVPRNNDFRTFYTGKTVVTRDGQILPVGPIIMDTVHPDLRSKASDAQAFYAHTGSAVADVRLYTNEHGIVAAGCLRPDTDPLAVRRLRASDISPDWRPIKGQHRIVALLAVNASGFLVEGIAASAGRFRAYGLYDSRTGRVGALVAAGAIHRSRANTAGQIDGVRAEIEALRAQVTGLSARLEAVDAKERRARARDALTALGLTKTAGSCGCGLSTDQSQNTTRFVDDGIGLLVNGKPVA